MKVAHLVRRFIGSWSGRPPGDTDLDWARSWLSDAEWHLWCRFGPVDRRHTIEVARRAALALGVAEPERAFIAGALLHDIGKVDADLGTLGRVVATVWGAVRGPAAERGDGHLARYLRHEAIGAQLCREVGSDPRTAALVDRSTGAPDDWRAALSAADDSF